MVWADKKIKIEIPEGDGVGIRSVLETWQREDRTTYTKVIRVFIARRDLIELINCISRIVKPNEPEQTLLALSNYYILGLDRDFNSNEENYRIPCSKRISSQEDRRGTFYCGDGFADDRTSLARPWICLACEFKIRRHFEAESVVNTLRNTERYAEDVREDLHFVYNNCVKDTNLRVEPSRLLELVRQFREADRSQSFEEIDRLVEWTNSRN